MQCRGDRASHPQRRLQEPSHGRSVLQQISKPSFDPPDQSRNRAGLRAAGGCRKPVAGRIGNRAHGRRCKDRCLDGLSGNPNRPTARTPAGGTATSTTRGFGNRSTAEPRTGCEERTEGSQTTQDEPPRCPARRGAHGWRGLSCDLSLAALINATGQADARALCPPETLPEDDFLGACVRCGLCGDACPYDILSLTTWGREAAVGTPFFPPVRPPCYMCTDIPCTCACPTGILDSNLAPNPRCRHGCGRSGRTRRVSELQENKLQHLRACVPDQG